MSTTKTKIGIVQIGTAAVVLGALATASLATRGPDGAPAPSAVIGSTSMTGSTVTTLDLSGPCDEVEHQHDARCVGSGTADTAPQPASDTKPAAATPAATATTATTTRRSDDGPYHDRYDDHGGRRSDVDDSDHRDHADGSGRDSGGDDGGRDRGRGRGRGGDDG